jgi:hypothetical protein
LARTAAALADFVAFLAAAAIAALRVLRAERLNVINQRHAGGLPNSGATPESETLAPVSS